MRGGFILLSSEKCHCSLLASGSAMLAPVAARADNAILPRSLRAIHFDHVVWKTIEPDDRWTKGVLNLAYHKDILVEPIPAAFIECPRRHSCAATVVRQFG
jgi:hypothetical protein